MTLAATEGTDGCPATKPVAVMFCLVSNEGVPIVGVPAVIEEAPKLSASTIDKLGTEAAPVTMPVAVKLSFSTVLTVGTSGEPATNAVAVKL